MTKIDQIARTFSFSSRIGVATLVAILFLCVSILLNTSSLHAQGGGGTVPSPAESAIPLDPMLITLGPEDWRIGVYFGVNYNQYDANNIVGLEGIPSCCPGYDGGNGMGLAFGGIIQYPVNDWIALGGRIYLQTYNGALIDEETETVDAGGIPETAVFEHRINADIWSVAFEPIASFEITEDLNVFGGLRGDIIAKKRFSQQESILSPEGISFENDQRERMKFEGQIPHQTSMHGSIVGGASYDFDFGTDGQVVISPEVSMWYGLSPVIEDSSWKIHGVRFAISAQFLRFEDPTEEELGVLGKEIERRKIAAARTRMIDLPVTSDDEVRENPAGTGSGG